MLNSLPAPEGDTNVTYVDHGIPSIKPPNPFTIRGDPFKMVQSAMGGLVNISKIFYDAPAVQELYTRRHQFDLFVLDQFLAEVRIALRANILIFASNNLLL